MGDACAAQASVFRDHQPVMPPRSDIAIGSEVAVTDGVITTLRSGTTRIPTVVTQSVTDFSCSDTTETYNEIAVGVVDVLGLDAAGGGRSVSSLTFDTMEVVTVSDVSSLGIAEGARYVWQGLRLKSFSVDFAGRSENEVQLATDQALQRLGARTSRESGDVHTYSYSGDDLFVAWQIVRFQQTRASILGEVLIEEDRSPLIGEYAVEVSELNDRWWVVVSPASALPGEATSDTLELREGRQQLARRPFAGGVRIDWLLVRQLDMDGPRGRMAIQQQTVPFEVVLDLDGR